MRKIVYGMKKPCSYDIPCSECEHNNNEYCWFYGSNTNPIHITMYMNEKEIKEYIDKLVINSNKFVKYVDKEKKHI